MTNEDKHLLRSLNSQLMIENVRYREMLNHKSVQSWKIREVSVVIRELHRQISEIEKEGVIVDKTGGLTNGGMNTVCNNYVTSPSGISSTCINCGKDSLKHQ